MENSFLKGLIGKNPILKFGGKEIEVDWKSWLDLDWNFTDVGKEYRLNSISDSYQRYTLFIKENNSHRYKCYDNVKDYMPYVNTILVVNGKLQLSEYKFIYVWDKDRKELIVILEMGENDTVMEFNEEFQKHIGVYDQIQALMNQ